MTLTSVPEPVTEPAAPEQAAPARTEPPRAQRVAHGLAFERIGAVYVWLGIIVLFSVWVPETFPNLATAHLIPKGGGPLVPAIALALALGLGIGVINAVVVVVMRIVSFIATLATGSL